MRTQDEIVEHAMRVLWALVQRGGGTVTVNGKDAGPLTGVFHVSWDDGQITVSIAEGQSVSKQ